MEGHTHSKERKTETQREAEKEQKTGSALGFLLPQCKATWGGKVYFILQYIFCSPRRSGQKPEAGADVEVI